jgi:ATP-dependent DNA helicase RecQ
VLLHRREDRAVHRFLMAGRYPSGSAFAAVYDGVRRAAPEPVTHAQLKEAVQNVAPTKLRVIVSSLKEAGLIAERRGGKLVLNDAAPAQTVDDLAAEYDARTASDREKLERMVSYGQTALCRWNRILEYFGDSHPIEHCGTCDNCEGNAVIATAAASA